MSDAIAATVAELNKRIDRLSSIVESNGNKAEVATDVIGALCDVLRELTAEIKEVRLSIPPGKGDTDGTPDEPG